MNTAINRGSKLFTYIRYAIDLRLLLLLAHTGRDPINNKHK